MVFRGEITSAGKMPLHIIPPHLTPKPLAYISNPSALTTPQVPHRKHSHAPLHPKIHDRRSLRRRRGHGPPTPHIRPPNAQSRNPRNAPHILTHPPTSRPVQATLDLSIPQSSQQRVEFLLRILRT